MKTALSTVNLVVGGIVLLGLALLALVGIIAVDDSPAAVPEALWAILGGVTGALASMLARTSIDVPDAPPALGPGSGGTPQPDDPELR